MPSLAESGPLVQEEEILKFRECILATSISLLSPLGKGCNPSFQQTLISITKGCFLQDLVETGKSVLEKKSFTFRQCILAFSLLSPL